jgi:hypothetical protein
MQKEKTITLINIEITYTESVETMPKKKIPLASGIKVPVTEN